MKKEICKCGWATLTIIRNIDYINDGIETLKNEAKFTKFVTKDEIIKEINELFDDIEWFGSSCKVDIENAKRPLMNAIDFIKKGKYKEAQFELITTKGIIRERLLRCSEQ